MSLPTSLNIKLIFLPPSPKIPSHTHSLPHSSQPYQPSNHTQLQKNHQNPHQSQLGLKNSQIEIFENYPIQQFLNPHVMGTYKPIILQKLLKSLQQTANLAFKGHKIIFYLPKSKINMNCGKYPLLQNILIRGYEYMQASQITIIAKKRGQIDSSNFDQIKIRIQKIQSQKLQLLNTKQPPQTSDTLINSQQKPSRTSSLSKDKKSKKTQTNNGKLPRKLRYTIPEPIPLDPLVKLKAHFNYLQQGISEFHSFVFSDVKEFYSHSKEYQKQVENNQNIDKLKQMKQQSLSKKIQTIQQKTNKPKPNQKFGIIAKSVTYYDHEEGINLIKQDLFNEEKNTKQKQNKEPGRRLNERRIGNVVDKVVEWTRWALNYKRKWYQICPQLERQKKYETDHSLEEAAMVVGVPKKTLDDYLFHINFGHKNKFNFNEHCMDRFAVLRMFVNKWKREGKRYPQEQVIVTKKVPRKRSLKRQKNVEKIKLEKKPE